MAQLHRRVLGLSDRGQLAHLQRATAEWRRAKLRALCALLLLGVGAPVASQDVADAAEQMPLAPAPEVPVANSVEFTREHYRSLAELGTELGSPDSAVRLRAYDTLRTLPLSRVSDVEARLRELRLNNDPPSAAAFNTLVEVRHHMGFERADEPTDLALGLRQLLGGQRVPSTTTLQVAERMALLRGLEQMDSLAADRLMVGFFQRGWSVWQWEARHVVARRGLRMLPALIEGRSAGNPDVRRWAVGSIRRLGVDSVGAAVQMVGPGQLPDVLRAYASLSDLNAMPAVITFVDHPDAAVREASREATAGYERNAIWQLRLAYRNKLGENADLSWSWQTTMQRLFEGLDARRLGPANELLGQGIEAARRGEWDTMRERYELALRREPMLPRRAEMAAGYAAEATQRLEGLVDAQAVVGVDGALSLLRRAVRLAPEHPDASGWRATVAFHEAERARVRGVLDEGAYEAVLAVRPGHAGASAVLADIEDGGVGEVQPTSSLLAARLLALFGVLLLLPYARLRRLALGAQDRLRAEVSRLRVRRTASQVLAPRCEAAVAPAELSTDHADAALLGVPKALTSLTPPAVVGVLASALASALPVAADLPSAPHFAPVKASAVGVLAWLGRFSQRLEPIYRTARRLAFFGRSLARRVLPARTSPVAALPSRARLRVLRVMASASQRAPALALVTARFRRPRGEATLAKSKRKLPSLLELRSTLAMLASSEPPQLPTPQATLQDRIPPLVPALGDQVEHIEALDADAHAAREESDLDELLFGDSQGGFDTSDEELPDATAPGLLPPTQDLLSVLARLAQDTSPGLLEAPDTLPS